MIILLAGNGLTITVSMVVFFLVTMILVLLLLYAKKKLIPEGTVVVSINNGEKKLNVGMGSSILATLGDNKVFLPSACGGSGTCAQCRCQVLEGGEPSCLPKPDFFRVRRFRTTGGLDVRLKLKMTWK